MYYVYYMFSYIYNEHERDSWLIVEKTLYTCLKAVASGGEKWNHGGRGGNTTVYNLTFVPSCNFARHKSDLSPNQTQVDLSFLKDTTQRSCLRLRPLASLWRSVNSCAERNFTQRNKVLYVFISLEIIFQTLMHYLHYSEIKKHRGRYFVLRSFYSSQK
jgi:hypothetical protein